ncbi:organic solvent resistance ABC transporter periplasmic protein [Mycobacterium intracellulare subsp. chimaera]|uniref:Mammalian cell entry protein n=1 Tax=Mycobacterium intracellulare subsp. chimaera TaxID=222805 RepID=A0A7U5RXX2_MYCIT|nr:mammalian cell entry protein [Mycobacterium intracellulare]ASL17546.1 organic solvent resistance ABC transporter periplasmic protein [Mycobacterium intracellulare subsp. chimaera]MDM3929481.1 mammalian cell entry protein [Mycobacterium intracellulare subsp. chimaera]
MLRGSESSQNRVLATIGLSVVLCVVLAASLIVVHPFGSRSADLLSVAISTPYVGQGVEPGTAVVLHGVKVGQVVGVAKTASGGVRLDTELQKQPLQGLTDAMSFDFRPINYFGVSGINLQPKPGGNPLHDGAEISSAPTGNFTLSELLSNLGNVSQASLTPQLVSVIDRVTRYTDGLNPLFETAVTVTRAVTDVQAVPTEQLLANTASISAAFPGFTDAALEASRRLTDFKYYPGQTFPPAETIPKRVSYPYMEGVSVPNYADETEDYWKNVYLAWSDIAANGLFGAVGKLEVSHVDDLLPLISGVKALTDITPPLFRPQDIAQKLADLRTRFEKLYAGNGDQRAINVRVVLDSLPGVAAPLGVVVEQRR